MVRAAVSGAIDYTGADPRNRQWRIKHRLLISEVERREDYELLIAAHQHWLALLSHGSLTEGSFKDVQTRTSELLTTIQNTVFPWLTSRNDAAGSENVKLDSGVQALIERYKQLQNKTD